MHRQLRLTARITADDARMLDAWCVHVCRSQFRVAIAVDGLGAAEKTFSREALRHTCAHFPTPGHSAPVQRGWDACCMHAVVHTSIPNGADVQGVHTQGEQWEQWPSHAAGERRGRDAEQRAAREATGIDVSASHACMHTSRSWIGMAPQNGVAVEHGVFARLLRSQCDADATTSILERAPR